MYQVSTPTHEFEFDFDISETLKVLVISYYQGNTLCFEKELEDLEIDGNIARHTLTQEETKLLDPDKKLIFQIRALTFDGYALVSDESRLEVKRTFNKEILS